MPLILPYKGICPRIADSAYIADTAVIIGDVEIGPESSVWFGCVLRGDVNVIRIGARSNIQDGTVIHVATKGQGTHLGNGVTVGHMALLHDCRIGTGGFIGMKACVMDGSVVEEGAMVAAGALVTPNKRIPSGQIWGGSPAKYLRELRDDDRALITWSEQNYCTLGATYRSGSQSAPQQG